MGAIYEIKHQNASYGKKSVGIVRHPWCIGYKFKFFKKADDSDGQFSVAIKLDCNYFLLTC